MTQSVFKPIKAEEVKRGSLSVVVANKERNTASSKCNIIVVGRDFSVQTNTTSSYLRSVVENKFRPAILVQTVQPHVSITTSYPNGPKAKRTFPGLEKLQLSTGAVKILNTPNAGGNSVFSELLSFEVLKRCYGAQLCKTEMELTYWPEGSKRTDYTVMMMGQHMGVSVTRAMNFKGDQHFTAADARTILSKKLDGVLSSTQNISKRDQFERQILHVWVPSAKIAQITKTEYARMKSNLKKNTIVIITVFENARWLFYEKSGDMDYLVDSLTATGTNASATSSSSSSSPSTAAVKNHSYCMKNVAIANCKSL